MTREVITHADTRARLQRTLLFPCLYYSVTGEVIGTEEIRARDLTTAVAAACRRVCLHRTATGFRVGPGRE